MLLKLAIVVKETCWARDLLSEQHSWGEIMPQSKDLRYAIIPIEVLCVHVQKFSRCKGFAGGMKNVQRLVYELAEFAETFIYGTHVRRLLA
jgi:hypothetical protein